MLLCINELPLKLRRKHIIMACVWVNKKKPDMNEYLKPFIKECAELTQDGIIVNYRGSVETVKVTPLMCVSDSIARPMLRNSTQFNGEFGCGLCYHPGYLMQSGKGFTRSYSIAARDYPYRTHDETMTLAREAEACGEPQKGIKGVSIFSEIEGFDVIECLDLDLFHALVNTAKRFANLWFHSKYSGKPCNISSRIAEVDRRLLSIKVSGDVSRAPRSLHERADYRGHEWFNFIVFYSIPILKGILPAKYLNHWGLLVKAIAMLMQNSVMKTDMYHACKFIREFSTKIDQLYGAQHVTFSSHLLTHLDISVKNFGQPWTHSAFMFESFLAELKAMVKSSNGVAYQLSTHMQLRIALPRMYKDVSYAMTEKEKEYFDSVSLFKPYADPHLVIDSVAFLGEPAHTKLSQESFCAIVQSGYTCSADALYPVYLRCVNDDVLYHSSNYSKVSRRDDTIALLDDDNVFLTDLFIVVNNTCLALGHYLLEDFHHKLCDAPLPHIRVFKCFNEGTLRCVPISMFESKLLSFTVQYSDYTLRLVCVNVLQMEMLS